MVRRSTNPPIYRQVVKVTQDYLGPAAERFVGRQIETHLNKKPEELTREDIKKLSDWLKIAIALLTDDGKIVESYVHDLLAIGTNNHKATT